MLSGAYVSLNDLINLSGSTYKVPRRRRTRARLIGDRVSKQRGRGVDFDEVRLYQPGDDVRNIDWNVTARKGDPHTKIYTEERERPTLIVVDQSMTMFLGSKLRMKSVAAAEFGARLAWYTLLHRDRVGGLVLSRRGIDSIKPLRNSATVVKLLNVIAQSNQKLKLDSQSSLQISSKQDQWNALLFQLNHVLQAHHRITVISDFNGIDGDSIQRLLVRGFRNDMHIVHVFDEIERNLPPSNFYSVTDGGAQLSFDSGQRKLRDEYEQRFELHQNRLQSMCLRFNVNFTSISTDDDLELIDFGS